MSDDRQDAERELMHLNGKMASVMDQISDLEAKGELDSSEERRLEDLKTDEESFDHQIKEVEGRL